MYCSFQLNFRHGFELKVSKDGSDDLEITEIEIETVDEDCTQFIFWEVSCTVKAAEIFTCGSFALGNTTGKTKTRQTNDCRTKDYAHEFIKQVVIEVGEDGSNDEIHVEICSGRGAGLIYDLDKKVLTKNMFGS